MKESTSLGETSRRKLLKALLESNLQLILKHILCNCVFCISGIVLMGTKTILVVDRSDLNREVRSSRLWLPTSAANPDRRRRLQTCLHAPKTSFLDIFPKRRVTSGSTRTATQWGERVSNG